MEEEELVVESYHPKDEGDQDAADRRRVQEIPGVVEDVPVSGVNTQSKEDLEELKQYSINQPTWCMCM